MNKAQLLQNSRDFVAVFNGILERRVWFQIGFWKNDSLGKNRIVEALKNKFSFKIDKIFNEDAVILTHQIETQSLQI